MGCDIHTFAEVRNKKTGQWEQTGKIFVNPFYSESRESQVDEDGFEWNAKMTTEPYQGRNYDLFAILADVRNGRGFAGIKTGEGFVPIEDPRGVPEDASPSVADEIRDYGSDGHSHSWFTVAELLAYDWDQQTIIEGVIPYEEFIKLKGTNQSPKGWSAGISGPGIVTYDQDEVPEDIQDRIERGERPYVAYRWAIKYRAHTQYFLETTIPALQALGEPDDVRMVFFFDN